MFPLGTFSLAEINSLYDVCFCGQYYMYCGPTYVIRHPSYSIRSSRLEKTHSGSNLAAFTPRYLWIRIALFEKRLQQIVVYLVSQSDK